MSALGDIPHGPDGLLQPTSTAKIHTVSVPLCVLHALDDPLLTWRTVANNEGLMRPDNLVQTGNGNLIMLLTKAGGHVGWPTGNLIFVDKWKWMSDAVMGFAEAVDKANRAKK